MRILGKLSMLAGCSAVALSTGMGASTASAEPASAPSRSAPAVVSVAAAASPAPCPAGYQLEVENEARMHTAPDVNSPVTGVYYEPHSAGRNDFQGDPWFPQWSNITDLDTGATGWVTGDLAYCAGNTQS